MLCGGIALHMDTLWLGVRWSVAEASHSTGMTLYITPRNQLVNVPQVEVERGLLPG